MTLSTEILAVVLAVVALATPFGLRFDQGGVRGMAPGEQGRQMLFTVMTLLFGTGFVALAAFATGAFFGFDGVEAMIPLAWVWVPVLVIATCAAARRGFGGTTD